MGHVEHAVLNRNTGYNPQILTEYLPYLNKGIVKNPRHSKAQDFIKAASYFMPAIENARYVGSMFTIRTVLPRMDATDARPTLVNIIDDRIVTIYSGKIGNSVRAANDVFDIVARRFSA
jgi:hypothetical protein